MMKKIISLILAVAMVTSVAAIPTSAATLEEKAAGRITLDAWTAREVPEGTVVTLQPDKSDDPNVLPATIIGGGFEVPGGWNDSLNTMAYWWDIGSEEKGNANWIPWTLNTDVKLEGNNSICADISAAMADLSGQNPPRLPFLGFQGVFIEPCFDNQVYRLRFYVKAEKELGFENPELMVYLLDPTERPEGTPDNLVNIVGNKNVVLSAANVDGHWYDQNEIAFDGGQNPEGTYKQGYGPFYQGKWIQIDSYFVTPTDFVEGAYSIQIHTQTGGDVKMFFDAFSLEKITMDEVDMGVPLKSLADGNGEGEGSSNKTVSVKFKKKSVKIKKGKKATLTVTLKGAKKATFTVDKKGKKVVKLSKKKAKSVVVTGKKKGKATITAKAAGKKATCKVTVK